MSTTTNLALNEPAYNSTSPTWDQPLNYNSTILDAVLGNTTSIALTNTNVTLTGPTSTGTGQTQAMRIVLTGTISTNIIVTIPSGISGSWIVYNTTSGTYTVTIASGGGGNSVLAPQGYNVLVYSDGTNIRYGNDTISTSPLPVSGGGTGSTTLTANNVILGNGTSAVQFVAPGTSGNALISNGTTWTSAAIVNSVSGTLIRSPQIITNTSQTSYTTPSNCNSIYVQMWGGGGGGGGSNGNSYQDGGGGGGGGGYVEFFSTVSPSTSYTIAVGAGGTSGTGSSGANASSGGSGGTSLVTIGGNTYSATGGAGGGGAYYSGGNGYTGANGAGGRPSTGNFFSWGNGGFGSNPSYGGGAAGILSTTYNYNVAGNGFIYGMGGSGGVGNGGSGGAGYQGVIRIWEYS